MHHSKLRGLFVSCVCVMLGNMAVGPVAVGQTPDATTLVRSVIDRERACKSWDTLYTDSVWQDEIGDALTFIHSVVRQDSLGRARYREERGQGRWSKEAPIESWEEWVCDGEVVVQLKELELSESAREALTHVPLSASIYDLDRRIPMRQPLSFGTIATDLERALAAGATIKVAEDVPGNTVRFEWQSVTSPQLYAAVVDMSGSCPNVLEETRRKLNGDLISRHRIRYRQDPSGVTIPEFAILERARFPRNPSVLLKPEADVADMVEFKQTFEVVETRINDPDDFAEDTFEIVLPQGTYVWDKRFRIDYVVGEEQTINERLAEFALAAQARKQDNPDDSALASLSTKILERQRDLARTATHFESSSSPKLWLVGGNLAVLAVIGAVLVVRRLRQHHRSARGDRGAS